MTTCDACSKTYRGLSFVIPSDAWLKISEGVKYLCLWCASDRLEKLGLHVRVAINFVSRGLDGTNGSVISQFEAFDAYIAKIKYLEAQL